MSKKLELVKTVAGKTGAKITGLVAFTIFIRYLGTNEFGKYILWQALLGFTVIFSDAGITNAITKRISEGMRGEIIASGLTIKAGISLVLAVIILIGSKSINSYIGAELAVALIPAMLLHNILSVLTGVLRGEQRVSTAESVKVGGGAIYICTGIITILTGYGVWGLIMAKLVSEAAQSAAMYYLLSTKISVPTVETMKSLLAFGKFDFVASGIGTAGYQWIDTLFIGAVVGSGAVAAYEAAWRVSLGVVVISQGTANVIFPIISELEESGNHTAIKEHFSQALAIGFLVVPPAAVGAWSVGNQILSLVFDIPSEYSVGIVLVILVFARGFDALNDISGRFLMGLDKPKFIAVSVIVFLFMNVLLNYILVPSYGIFGAAIATSVAFASNALLNYMFLNRIIHVRFPWREFGIFTLSAGIMWFVLLQVQSMIPPFSIVNLIINISTGIFSFALVTFLFLITFSQYSPQMLESIKKKL